jgi:sugar lactone lactonase YvrE
MTKTHYFFFFLWLLCLTSHRATAIDIYWTGNTSTDWNTASNWNPAQVPTTADIVWINSATNNPVISSGTVTVGMVRISGQLTVNAGAVLNLRGVPAEAACMGLAGLLTNNGTINIGVAGQGKDGIQCESGGRLINTGTITFPDAGRYQIYGSSGVASTTITNGTTGTLDLNGGIFRDITGRSPLALQNSGLVKAGTIQLDLAGSSVINNHCGQITCVTYNQVDGTSINAGFLEVTGTLTQSGGTFTNDGVLNYGTLAGSITRNTGSVVVNENPTNTTIFTYEGAFTGTVDGIFSNSAATTSAGTFVAPNSFTPSGLPNGPLTLYAKITPSGGGCVYVVPFAYTVPPPSLATFYSTPNSVCSGQVATFRATVGDVTGSYDFTLTNGTSTITGATTSTAFSQSWTTAGSGPQSFTLRVSDNGLSTIATTTLTVNPPPVVSLVNTGTGSCADIASLSVSSNAAIGSLAWYRNGSLAQTTLPQTGSAGVTVAGGAGTGSGATQLNSPTGMYIDHDGAIYVADLANNRIQKFPPNSTVGTAGTTVAGGNGAGSGATQLNNPVDVYVDGSGAIYVADKRNHRIQKFPPNSTGSTAGTTVAGGTGLGSGAHQLNTPRGVFVDGSGAIYVSDYLNSRIQKFPANSTAGTPGTTVADQLRLPSTIYIDGSGAIYVADQGNDRIQKFPANSTAGTPGTTVAGGNGSGSGPTQLDSPFAVYVDSRGAIYVADQGNNRVQQFPPNSTGATAGTTVAGKNGFGAGAAQFIFPQGLHVDGSGSVYVADQGNNRIQKWAATINPAYAPTLPGTYSVLVTSAAGCTAITNSLTVTAPPAANIAATPSLLVCSGNSLTLTASGGDSFAWSTGSNSTSIVLTPTSTTLVSVTAMSGGCISVNSVVVTVSPTPMVSLTNTVAGSCVGVASLSVSSDQAASRIDWYNGNTLVYSSVLQISPNGSTVAGGNNDGDGANQLNTPSGVYVDGVGNLYVADAFNNRIQQFGPNSTSATAGTTVAGGNGPGPAANQLRNPAGVYMDGVGNLYVVDNLNHRIQRFGPNSTSATAGTTVAGGNSPGPAADQLTLPYGVYVDGVGNVYVAEVGNNRIQRFGPNSTSSTAGITIAGGNNYGNAANQLANPYGVYLDGVGNLYVADYGNHRIQRFGPNSTSATAGTTVAGGNGSGPAADQLVFPFGVYADGIGNVYVADWGNSRIQFFGPNSTSSTAGTTLAGGNGDGDGVNQLNGPSGVYIDRVGNLYVADTYNHRIQKFSATISPVYSPTAAGTYTARITTANGCTATTNSITITNPPSVSVAVTPSLTVCSGNSLTLTASGGDSFAWSTGSNSTSIVLTPTSTTVVSVTAILSGCTSVSSVTVTVNTTPTATLTPGPSNTLTCSQTSVTLTATGATGFIFSGPGLNQSGASATAVVSRAGLYSVTVTSGNSCTNTASTTIFSNTAAPTVSINPTSGTLTCSTPSLTLTGSTSGTGLLWSNAQTTPTIVVSMSGTYSVTATAANGCVSTTSVTINTDMAGVPPTPTLSASSSVVCAGANVQVVASGVGLSPVMWYRNGQPTGQSSATLLLGGVQSAQAGQYVLVVAGVCSVTSAPFALTVNPLPVVTLTFPTGSTVNGPGTGVATITVPSPFTNVAMQAFGGTQFEWLTVLDRINGYEIRQVDSNTTGLFTITRTGPFRLIVTDGNGCQRTVEGTVVVRP